MELYGARQLIADVASIKPSPAADGGDRTTQSYVVAKLRANHRALDDVDKEKCEHIRVVSQSVICLVSVYVARCTRLVCGDGSSFHQATQKYRAGFAWMRDDNARGVFEAAAGLNCT